MLRFIDMNPEENFQETEQVEEITPVKHVLHTATPLSKYLALALFIILPFIGGWIGYSYSPSKVVEVERVVEIEKIVVKEVVVDVSNDELSEMSPNIFKPSLLAVGDQYGSMFTKEIELLTFGSSQNSEIEYVKAKFTGEVTLVGQLRSPTGEPLIDRWMGPDYSISNLSTSSVQKLPYSKYDSTRVSFGINNSEVVDSTDVKNGDLVEVVIFEYNYLDAPVGAWNTTEIVSIKKIESD